jgi:hypothetical protein
MYTSLSDESLYSQNFRRFIARQEQRLPLRLFFLPPQHTSQNIQRIPEKDDNVPHQRDLLEDTSATSKILVIPHKNEHFQSVPTGILFIDMDKVLQMWHFYPYKGFMWNENRAYLHTK